MQGVIKFVGHDRLPQPLRADEVNRLLGIADEAEQEEPEEEIPFLVGQAVAITEGPFTAFNGTVEEVRRDRGRGGGRRGRRGVCWWWRGRSRSPRVRSRTSTGRSKR